MFKHLVAQDAMFIETKEKQYIKRNNAINEILSNVIL